MEDTVFFALARQSGTKRSEWPLAAGAHARSFAHRLFGNTDPPMAVAMIVLAYLDRIRYAIAFDDEALACERLLLGLFSSGIRYVMRVSLSVYDRLTLT